VVTFLVDAADFADEKPRNLYAPCHQKRNQIAPARPAQGPMSSTKMSAAAAVTTPTKL
jgi:hypothetical protein